MLPRNHPDRIRIVFDDPRLVANAGHPRPPPWAPSCAASGGATSRQLDRVGRELLARAWKPLGPDPAMGR